MWCLGTWLSGGLDCVRLIVGLNDPGGFSNLNGYIIL